MIEQTQVKQIHEFAQQETSMKKMDIETACGYCKAQYSKVLYQTYDTQKKEYTLNECMSCHAIFLSPCPTKEELAIAYNTAYYGERSKKFNPFIEKILDYFRSKRANLVVNHTQSPAKVLDIGCGNGQFLQYILRNKGYEAYGIEMAGGSAERAAQIEGIQLKVGVLEEGDFPEHYFDAITLFHVFEHLTEPIQTLEIIQKILKPNGILVLSFPNIDSFQSQLFKGKWLHLDPPRHLFFFKPEDFKKLMEGYDFEVVEENYFSTEYNPFGFQQSILNQLLPDREVLYEHLKGNTVYTAPYSKVNLMAQDVFFKLSYPLFVATDLIEAAFKKSATVEFVFRKKGI